MTTHRVLHQYGGEVVCTCGEYFKTERQALGLTNGPRTALEFFANHIKQVTSTFADRHVCGFDMSEGDECCLDAGHEGQHS